MFLIYIQTKTGRYFNFKVNDYVSDVGHSVDDPYLTIRAIGGTVHFIAKSEILLMSVTEKEAKGDDQ